MQRRARVFSCGTFLRAVAHHAVKDAGAVGGDHQQVILEAKVVDVAHFTLCAEADAEMRVA